MINYVFQPRLDIVNLTDCGSPRSALMAHTRIPGMSKVVHFEESDS